MPDNVDNQNNQQSNQQSSQNNQQVVDGFSDAPPSDKNVPDPADKGWEGQRKPLSPDEEARLKSEAYDDEKKQGGEQHRGE